MKTILAEKCKPYGIFLTAGQLDKFELFYNRLVEYNKKVNLTRITEPHGVAVKHFLDSMLGAELLTQGCKVCDIGAGAGFPSIPLKILRDDLDFTLLEAREKKVKFLKEVTDELCVKVNIKHQRAEDAKGQFDFVVARAVGKLELLAAYASPLLKKGGSLIAYKGDITETELTPVLGRVIEIKRYLLYGDKRSLVIVSRETIR